jgi:hypothetical protein
MGDDVGTIFSYVRIFHPLKFSRDTKGFCFYFYASSRERSKKYRVEKSQILLQHIIYATLRQEYHINNTYWFRNNMPR